MTTMKPTKYAASVVEISNAILLTQELARKIDRGPSGREVSLAITKLEEARMWLIQAFSLRVDDE